MTVDKTTETLVVSNPDKFAELGRLSTILFDVSQAKARLRAQYGLAVRTQDCCMNAEPPLPVPLDVALELEAYRVKDAEQNKTAGMIADSLQGLGIDCPEYASLSALVLETAHKISQMPIVSNA